MAWLVPMVAAVVIVQSFLMGGLDQGGANVWPFTLVIVIGAFGVGLFISVRQQLKAGRAQWNSYELTMSDNVLRRQASNFPTVEILRPEVTKIVESRGQGLTVTTDDRHRFIFISEHLVAYAEARERLSAWKPLVRVVHLGVHAEECAAFDVLEGHRGCARRAYWLVRARQSPHERPGRPAPACAESVD